MSVSRPLRPRHSLGLLVNGYNAANYIEVLRQFRQRHQTLNGVFLIQDGDPSHTAHDTRRYLADDANRWWRSRYTPAHAS